jgi:hypothetical protein
MIKLEVGKRYVTRNGKVTGPMELTPDIHAQALGYYYRAEIEHHVMTWSTDGSLVINHSHVLDLVCDYQQPSLEDRIKTWLVEESGYKREPMNDYQKGFNDSLSLLFRDVLGVEIVHENINFREILPKNG